jgi:hypothetical protein
MTYRKWIWFAAVFILLLLVLSPVRADSSGRNSDAVEGAPNSGSVINPVAVSDGILMAQTIQWNNQLRWNEAIRRNETPKPVKQSVAVETPTDADFWRRLANCENPNGDAPGGYFQFMGSTRSKVGWSPDQSYEQQRSEAIWWAQQIHPREGTSTGWPQCWWVALGR